MSSALCDSLITQWTNPIRTWTRDIIVCISGNAVEIQSQYNADVLANGRGNVTSGHLSQKLQYAKLANTPPRRGQAYANQSNPNSQHLPIVNNKIILNCINKR